MRKLTALILGSALVAGLAACAPAPGVIGAGCAPTFSEGASSSTVRADGTVGTEPTITFPTPLRPEGVQLSVLELGQGTGLEPGQYADLQITGLFGRDGTILTSTGYEEGQYARRIVGDDSVIGDALVCAPVGSRLAVTAASGEVFGPGALTSFGFDDDETVVLVLDVDSGYPARADGRSQLGSAGLPAVVTAPSGQPGITIPAQDAPGELTVSALKRGDGAVIERGDEAVLHYTGWLWGPAETVFDSSWENGVPVNFGMRSIDEAEGQGGLIPGFVDGVVGQTVGSQVLIVIPPEFGYPAGTSPTSIPEGSTLIFVVDVLGVA